MANKSETKKRWGKEYWNDEFESMPLKEMEEFQLKCLQNTVERVYKYVPFYQKKFDEIGIKPKDIQSLRSLKKLPFTVKTDLRDNYPFGLCTVKVTDEVVRIHASSGTTGKPITGPYTADDMKQWGECMARTLWAAGVRANDIVQNAYGMGLFTGGMGFLEGADTLGCAVIPAGPGMTERQIMLIKDFGTTALFCTPSYALTINEKAKEIGVDIRNLSLKIGVFGAEPWSDEIRQEIEDRMGINAHEAYGLTELMGPGVAFSCSEYSLHINEDHILPEIIDPSTGEVLPLGTEGELVLTSLQRIAMPMIRYRTKDITTLHRKKCKCGRTLITMERVRRRSDDMKIVNGVNIFPSQIESILMDSKLVEPLYQIILKKKGYLDAMIVQVEAKEEIYKGGKEKIAATEKLLENHIHGIIGLGVEVNIVPPNTLPRSEGKAKRLIDERKE